MYAKQNLRHFFPYPCTSTYKMTSSCFSVRKESRDEKKGRRNEKPRNYGKNEQTKHQIKIRTDKFGLPQPCTTFYPRGHRRDVRWHDHVSRLTCASQSFNALGPILKGQGCCFHGAVGFVVLSAPRNPRISDADRSSDYSATGVLVPLPRQGGGTWLQ